MTASAKFRAWRERMASPELTLPPWLPDLLGGAILGLIFLPSTWAWLTPLPLAFLHQRLFSGPTSRLAAQRGFAFSLAFFSFHLAWLPLSLGERFGPVLGFLALLIIPAAAVTWAAPLLLCRAAFGRLTLLALPFTWVLLEYLRLMGPLAFGWGAPGYALTNTPLAQLASLGGVPLLTLLVTGSASLLAALGRHNWPLISTVLLALWGGSWWWGRAAPVASPERTALLVQGNVNPVEKSRGQAGDLLSRYVTLTRQGLTQGRVELVVWPESAILTPPGELSVLPILEALRIPLLLGAPGDVPGQARNSAYGVNAGVVGRQDKRVLVPFGEVIPFRSVLGALARPVLQSLGYPEEFGLTPGRKTQVLALGEAAVGVQICYESTFPRLSRDAVEGGANVLAVISNDAWFGRGQGAEQHFQMGRLRAIEARRYLLRAGNDGVSAVIDPWGRVLRRFPRGQQGTYRAPFGLMTGKTPYVRYHDWMVMLSGLALAGLGTVRFKRIQIRRNARSPEEHLSALQELNTTELR
ncbi:apolipoprotein N-acyltransferase [Deinococcus xinjiangensis]